MNPHHGSSLESFLDEEGLTDEANRVAADRVKEWIAKDLEDYMNEIRLLIESGNLKRIECLYSRGNSDYTYSWPIVPGYLHPRDING